MNVAAPFRGRLGQVAGTPASSERLDPITVQSGARSGSSVSDRAGPERKRRAVTLASQGVAGRFRRPCPCARCF